MEWVSMSEQLPPALTQVLGWNKTQNMKHNANSYRLFVYCAENTCNITHWMPLPEPPKGDNND